MGTDLRDRLDCPGGVPSAVEAEVSLNGFTAQEMILLGPMQCVVYYLMSCMRMDVKAEIAKWLGDMRHCE